MSDPHFLAFFGFKLAQTEVYEILISVVVKVTQNESFDATVTILECTFPCSFACGRKVSLHGRCTRIQVTNNVSVFGPLVSENLFKVFWKPFEWATIFGLGNNVQLNKPCQQ